MNIAVGKYSGFCFGVKRAVEMVEELLKSGPVYTIGEIIHNRAVVEDLRARGAVPAASAEDLPNGARAGVRAHDVPVEPLAL